MKSSFDSHLQFDLPYRYELTRTRADDGSKNTVILCNTSFDNSGEKTGEVQIRLMTKEGGIREESRNLRADFPAALLGTISEMGIGIGISSSSGYSSPGRNLVVQILMLIVAIEYADQTYILLGLKTGMEKNESENIELLTRHMNRVLDCLTLDGKQGRFERLTTTAVRRALKENAAKNEKDPTAAIRSTRKRTATSKSASSKSAPAKSASSGPAPAAPPRSPEEQSRMEDKLRKILKRQKKAKREAEEAVNLALQRRKEAAETAALQNTLDLAALEELEERRSAEREALEDWERRERRLAARRGERADALAAQALDAALHPVRERYRALVRRELPRREDLLEELAQLEAGRQGVKKKERKARIAEIQAELEASSRALSESLEACRAAESGALAQVNARRAEFLATAEREITLEPRPEQTAQAKEGTPAVLEVLLAQKLRVGTWYGLDTLRAMLPEYAISQEQMGKVAERLQKHNCARLDYTGKSTLLQYVQKLPKPVVKPEAFKRKVQKILDNNAYWYTIGALLRYFDPRISAADVSAALTALVEEQAVRQEYDGPTPIYSSAAVDAEGQFDPETMSFEPVGLSSIVSIPGLGPVPAEETPAVHLETPKLEREEYEELILMLLSDRFDYRLNEVQRVLQNAGFELSDARVGGMLQDLCKQGRLTVTVRNRAKHYSKA